MTAIRVKGVAIGDSFKDIHGEVLTVLSFITPERNTHPWRANVSSSEMVDDYSIEVDELKKMHKIRPLKVELVAPSGDTLLTVIDMDYPDNSRVFAGVRDHVGEKPEPMSYFRATDLTTGERYDLAMLFTREYLETATVKQLETNYQDVANALVRLVVVINKGGFE